MALESYFNSSGQLAMPDAVPNISPLKEGCPSSSSVDFPISLIRMAAFNANLVSGDVNANLLEKLMNPGSNASKNSLVADANMLLPSGSLSQMNGSANMEPYLNLPSGLKSFSSRTLSNSVMDGSPLKQMNAHALGDQSIRQVHKRQQPQKIAGLSPLVGPRTQNYHLSLPTGMNQEPNTLIQMLKKPRIDVYPDDALQQQILQKLLLRHDLKQFQDHDPQMKALIQLHRQQNELRKVHSVPQLRGVHAEQSEQLRQYLLQQATRPASFMHSTNDGVCSRKLIQYLCSLRSRPQDNSIDFWRNFVSEFYAPCAKERWCLSLYQNIGLQASSVLSLGAMEPWCCDICGSRSGKGFEASFEILPRLWKVKFESGAVEEILFLEFPREWRSPTGKMLLEYEKAVQESVYDQFRVVREGKLRVTFGQDLKILSWEFCASHHQEYFPRRLVEPQVNQLLQAAKKYQGTLGDVESGNISVEALQANSNMFLEAGHQLVRNMEIPTVNDLGFAKRYVRSMQIAEVLNIMKDLMTFSYDRKIGPIESLKLCPHEVTLGEVQGSVLTEETEETSQQGSIQSVVANGNWSMAMHVVPDSYSSDTSSTNDKVLPYLGVGDMELVSANYYHKLLRENLFNPSASVMKLDQSFLMGCSSQRAMPPSLLAQQSSNCAPLRKSLFTGLPSSESFEASKNFQQQMIDKLLQESLVDSQADVLGKQKELALGEINENIISGLPTGARGTNIIRNRPVYGNTTTASIVHANLSGNVRGSAEMSMPGSINNSPRLHGSKNAIKEEPDIQEFHLPDTFRGIGAQFPKNNIQVRYMVSKWAPILG